MKTRLVTFSMVAVFAIALALEGLAATFQQAQPQTETTAAAPRQNRQRRNRSGARQRVMRGVPSGVDNCMKHLAEMSMMEPLPDYEGHPSEIINNGLLWPGDPNHKPKPIESKCYIGDDQAKKLQLFELAKAWRLKDTAKVRSILQELGATSGGGN